MNNSKSRTEEIKAKSQIRRARVNNPIRNNKPYTTKENKLIWTKYHLGMHPETIALSLGRTEKGIYNQITTLKKSLKPKTRVNPEVKINVEKVIKKKKKSAINNNMLIGYSALLSGFILGVLVTAYIA